MKVYFSCQWQYIQLSHISNTIEAGRIIKLHNNVSGSIKHSQEQTRMQFIQKCASLLQQWCNDGAVNFT